MVIIEGDNLLQRSSNILVPLVTSSKFVETISLVQRFGILDHCGAVFQNDETKI